MNNKILIGAVAVVVILAGFAVSRPIEFNPTILPAEIKIIESIKESLGAFSGPDIFIPVFFRDGATLGGNVLATSTASTAMVPNNSFFDNALIQITPNTADLVYTFPASSTLANYIPHAGDTMTIMIYNASTTAGIDLGFAAGTGVEIKSITASSPADSIDEAAFGLLTFTRKINSDIAVQFHNGEAD